MARILCFQGWWLFLTAVCFLIVYMYLIVECSLLFGAYGCHASIMKQSLAVRSSFNVYSLMIYFCIAINSITRYKMSMSKLRSYMHMLSKWNQSNLPEKANNIKRMLYNFVILIIWLSKIAKSPLPRFMFFVNTQYYLPIHVCWYYREGIPSFQLYPRTLN